MPADAKQKRIDEIFARIQKKAKASNRAPAKKTVKKVTVKKPAKRVTERNIKANPGGVMSSGKRTSLTKQLKARKRHHGQPVAARRLPLVQIHFEG